MADFSAGDLPVPGSATMPYHDPGETSNPARMTSRRDLPMVPSASPSTGTATKSGGQPIADAADLTKARMGFGSVSSGNGGTAKNEVVSRGTLRADARFDA